jgi:signal transduction histidine kinase
MIRQELLKNKDSRFLLKIQHILERLFTSVEIQDSSADLMTNIVADFLDFAQLKSGKFRLNIQPFNIRDAVEKVISIQKLSATRRNIELCSSFTNISTSPENVDPEYHTPILKSDKSRIMQVLLNLQSNALKFTEAGSVKIHVGIESQGDD